MNTLRLTLALGLSNLLLSCSDKYMSLKSRYSFRSESGKPDYNDLDYWAAHPWKKDPSDSIPQALKDEPVDSMVDVFFLYPTSFTHPKQPANRNAAIDDSYLNAKTDYSSILYQASAFNHHARVFSPRYRQANISVFFDKDTIAAAIIFEIAYVDIKAAFEHYLLHWNKGRPIIIASHSQGSKMASRLLKEFFDAPPGPGSLAGQLVAAYILGWPVPRQYFRSLKMCVDSMQTGCICSWRTLRKNYIPPYLKQERGNSLVTNPLTWTTDSDYAPRQMNNGSILYKFNTVYRHSTDAQVSNGFLWVRRPRFPWSFLYLRRNYHAGDFNLYYVNIRQNVQLRINRFLRQ